MSRIKILPALIDNYMFLIIDDANKTAVAVDPVEPETVILALKEDNLCLAAILTTHHHWDHSGGNNKLVELLKNDKKQSIDVYGGNDTRVEGLTKPVSHNDPVEFGGYLKFKCLATPCHTTNHICYFMEGNEQSPPRVFTGDTLFLSGCGRFFEGNAEQMNKNFNEILASLPDTTLVYCGHEYSVANLKFAQHLQPESQSVKDKLKWCEERRVTNIPTIPSTIGEEKMYNPFMRVSDASLKRLTNTSDDVSTMKVLRELKDNFKAN